MGTTRQWPVEPIWRRANGHRGVEVGARTRGGGEPKQGGTLAPGAARGVVAGDEGSRRMDQWRRDAAAVVRQGRAGVSAGAGSKRGQPGPR